MTDKTLLQIINFYVSSNDFNGILASQIDFPNEKSSKTLLKEFLRKGDINMVFEKGNYNIHIQQFPPFSIKKQEELLDEEDLNSIGVYPTKKHLENVVDKSKFIDQHFTYLLAIGEAQLSYQKFDLSILEMYRNDPRYDLNCGDFEGHLSVSGKHEVEEKDDIFIQSFGFGLDENGYRCVICFLRYLSDLTPTHQKIWEAKTKTGEFVINNIYAKTTCGQRPDEISIFQAMIEEYEHINNMAMNIKRIPLFKDDYKDNRPKAFGFLLRPTQKAFHEFVHLLDKMISENINKDFFKGDINLEKETLRDDGKTIVEQKGTLTLLYEWIMNKWHTPNTKPLEDMNTTFREIRKLRQIPSHTIEDDEYNLEYFKRQRNLMISTYSGIRAIRLLFKNYSKNKDYEVPFYLNDGTHIIDY